MGTIEDLKDEKPWQDELPFYNQFKDKVLIKHLKGPLFFGFTTYLKNQVANMNDDNIQVLIIRMDEVPLIDQSGLYALEDIIFDLEKRGIKVFFVNLQKQPLDILRSIYIIPNLVKETHVFKTIEEAFDYLKTYLKA